MPVPTLKEVAETPESDHGDTDESPMPAPKAIKSRVRAHAATAPAAMEAGTITLVARETGKQLPTRDNYITLVQTALAKLSRQLSARRQLCQSKFGIRGLSPGDTRARLRPRKGQFLARNL